MKDIVIQTANNKSVVRCGAGAFDDFAPKLKDNPIFIITDGNVDGLYGNLAEKTFGRCEKFVMPAGEKNKNPRVLLKILEKMLGCGMHRNCVVVAFGGGVVGDIAGLAASLYMRGVRLVQIPTTLLAQVDSSVGGKTAVDLGKVKNAIGAFYQPEEVICDPRFLSTLPQKQIRCGFGEIIKYGALNADIFRKLWDNIGRFDSENFREEIIYDCIKHKSEVVQSDERDLDGVRKTLNLGHTTGHALELLYGGRSHGEYVLIGMYYELKIAENLNICGGQYAGNIEKLIFSVLKKIPAFKDIDRAAYLAERDKKNDGELISLIVPEREGVCREVKLEKKVYADYLQRISFGGLI